MDVKMKKIKTSFIILLASMVASCSTVPNLPPKEIDNNQFDQIRLDQSESEVKKIIGEPSSIDKDKESKNWYYNNNNKNAFQRATISFDLKSKKVDGVLIIPLESEPEFHLNYLQNKKFPASDYVEAPLGRCHRDYFPKEVFYISTSKGIIIVLDSVSNSIESYSWTSTQYAADLIKKIKNCER